MRAVLECMRASWAQRWPGRTKIAPALAALIVNAVIGYALIVGLRGGPSSRTLTDDAPMAPFDIKPLLERKVEPSQPVKQSAAKVGGGSELPPTIPRKQEVAQSPIMAPAPIVTSPAPPFPAEMPPAAIAGDAESGGGRGTGSGGGDGSETGAGSGTGDGGAFSQAKQTGGRFRNSDFPDWLRGAGRLKIGVRYAIGPSGHVDRCEIIEKSGYAEVDAMTCRIIMERYRFRPARDPDGYAVTEVREEDYRWRVR